jgi:hypothetical protein
MDMLLDVLNRRLPKSLRKRGCSMSAWADRCMAEEFLGVERFLRVLCDAFLLKRSEAVFLHPEDRPMDIYRELYRFWPVDALELEHLRHALQREFGLRLPEEEYIQLSLGELYEASRSVIDTAVGTGKQAHE